MTVSLLGTVVEPIKGGERIASTCKGVHLQDLRLLGERPKLWTPQGAHLSALMDDFFLQEFKTHGALDARNLRPIIKPNGDVVVIRPLNLIEEIELFLREERLKRYAAELGLVLIAGEAAGNWTFTNNTRTYILNGTFDWDTDSFKEALLLSTSNIGASSTTYAGVTNEHANANGYTTGGIAVTITLAGTTTVTVDSSTDPVWTASGGSIVARFGLLYEVSGNVAAYFLLDSTPADVTATAGNTLTIQHHASGIYTLA